MRLGVVDLPGRLDGLVVAAEYFALLFDDRHFSDVFLAGRTSN